MEHPFSYYKLQLNELGYAKNVPYGTLKNLEAS